MFKIFLLGLAILTLTVQVDKTFLNGLLVKEVMYSIRSFG